MHMGHWLAAAVAVWTLAGFAPANSATFTYEDPQCAEFSVTGGGSAYTLQCTPIATPACQLQASPSKPLPGVKVTLIASCTGNPFGWIFTSGPTAVAQTPMPCGTTTSFCVETNPPAGAETRVYQVLGGNAAGRGPLATLSVTWQ